MQWLLVSVAVLILIDVNYILNNSNNSNRDHLLDF